MTHDEIISWLLEGDISIQYQTHRDLLGLDRPDLRARIAQEGWGKAFLDQRQPQGHWGQRFYQPKWISSHYTLLDLKNLNISPEVKSIRESLDLIFKNEKGLDGGIGAFGAEKKCDVCVNGMVLNYASYFGMPQAELRSVVDFLLAEIMGDGGFNCRSNRSGAVHSSLHSTISVLEGILEYMRNGYTHRQDELMAAKASSEEFILMHRLYKSDKTGKIIDPRFLRLPYPGRWYYGILRSLDYFQNADLEYDERMNDALQVLLSKRTKEGLWKLSAKYAGQQHFEMEKAGKPSRWNTLRAMRVLKRYPVD